MRVRDLSKRWYDSWVFIDLSKKWYDSWVFIDPTQVTGTAAITTPVTVMTKCDGHSHGHSHDQGLGHQKKFEEMRNLHQI